MPTGVDALKAIYAYGDVLSDARGKKTYARRTWQMMERYGIIEAVERAVNRPTETKAYKALIDLGLEEFSFETVVNRYPELFSGETVKISEDRHIKWNRECPISKV